MVSPLTNKTAKTSFGEDLVKIRPAVARAVASKFKKNTERPVKHSMSPSLAASGAV